METRNLPTYSQIRAAVDTAEGAAIEAKRSFEHNGSSEGLVEALVRGELAVFWYDVRTALASVRDYGKKNEAAIVAVSIAAVLKLREAAHGVALAVSPSSGRTRTLVEAVAVLEAIRSESNRVTEMIRNWGPVFE